MQAKDTVMSDKQVEELYGIKPHQLVPGVQIDELKLAQAEISFKVGEKQGYDKGVTDRLREIDALIARLKTEKLVGIREVVEFVESEFWQGIYCTDTGRELWQAKLREWRIE